mgnify:CR=1 FL=1
MEGRDLTIGPDLRQQVALPGNPLKLWMALTLLLVLAGLAIAGPWGVIAWYENADAFEAKAEEIALLKEDIGALQNRVALLDPKKADPDLAGELVRRNLGVLHEDEVVITVPED